MKRKRDGPLGPARKQANEEDVFDERPQSAFYNIWYDKVEDFSKWRDRRDAKLAGKRFQLDVEKDSGETKAAKDSFICLYYARGKCVHGADCKYFHRIPNEDDEARISLTTDVFGRERHKTDREDMGGVGSFSRDNKTLYVGGIRTSTPDAEPKIRAHFGQFGEIEKMNIIHGRSIVFVTYKWRTSAEFAKEAVADQSVVSNEIVNVRWAHEDPNPRAIREKEERVLDQALTAIHQSNPEYFSQYQMLHGEGLYPQTDHQYYGHQQPLEGGAPAPQLTNGAAEEWIQVGDETTGYYWVPAPPKETPAAETPATNAETKSAVSEGSPKAPADSSSTAASATATAPQPSVTSSTAAAGESKPLTAEEQAQKSYMVWQSYYASSGYPYYYADDGQVVYYDPSQYDAATLAQLQLKTTPPVAQSNADYYQYYSQVPVQRTDRDYFNHFQSYSETNQ